MSTRPPNFSKESEEADGSRAQSAGQGSNSNSNEKPVFMRVDSQERKKMHKKHLKMLKKQQMQMQGPGPQMMPGFPGP